MDKSKRWIIDTFKTILKADCRFKTIHLPQDFKALLIKEKESFLEFQKRASLFAKKLQLLSGVEEKIKSTIKEYSNHAFKEIASFILAQEMSPSEKSDLFAILLQLVEVNARDETQLDYCDGFGCSYWYEADPEVIKMVFGEWAKGKKGFSNQMSEFRIRHLPMGIKEIILPLILGNKSPDS